MKSLFVGLLLSLSAFASEKVPFTYPYDVATMMGQPEFTVAIEEARKALPKDFEMSLASQLMDHDSGVVLENTVEEMENDNHDATVTLLVAKMRKNSMCMASLHGKIVGRKINYKWSIKYVVPVTPTPGC